MRIALLLALCGAGCGEPAPAPEPPPAATSPEPAEPAAGGVSWAQAMADLDAELARAEARAEARPESWMRVEAVAAAYLARARLGGSLDDYAAAEALIDRAFELADEGSGPFLTRAGLNFSLHRLPLVQADLDAAARRVLVDDRLRAELTRREAALAFQRGDYRRADQGFEAALALHPSFAALSDLAQLRRRTGDYPAAEALLDRAEGMYHGLNPEPRAWLHLQRAILDLDRGRYRDMLAHLDAADGVISGWWLVEEHRAEALALLGRTDEARAIYERVIADTGKAEYMDALASILRAEGDEAGALALIERAAALYEADMARFPEAAAGHALLHYLRFGPADRALELARENAALRPKGEARISLAEALLGTGDIEGARAEIEAVLASAWRSPELYQVAAAIYEAAGDEALARRQREAAERFGG